MANNLIFPIGFDLESGVQDAIKKGDAALRQIEAAMNRKPIVLRAEVDANKFQMFSRQFTNSIDGISAKLAQAQRIWNSMSFDVKFDSDGNLSRRAQIVFDAFQQLTQASATMGQRLGEVNRNLAKSEADTARAITAEYNKRQQLINEQIRLKERQAAAEERVRQSQLKGVNVGYVDTQKQVEAVRNLRLQYEAILPMLNAMAQRRVEIRVGIDRQFEPELKRLDVEVNRTMAQIQNAMAKGVNTDALRFHLQKLNSEINNIRQQKIDIFNNSKINADLSRLRTEISSVFGELQNAERKLAADNSLNTALDAQSQKVLKLHADIQKLDQQIAQLNAQGKMYNADGSFSTQAISILQQRIALTKQLEQEAITGQQAQIRLEQQLREEKRKTEQEAKNAAKEAERQAKAEAAARKQAQDAANAENKARQEAYNARRRQGQETQRILNKEAKSIADITAKLQIQQQRLQSANIGSAKFNKIAEEVKRLTQELDKANKKMRELTGQTQSSAATQSAAVRQVSQEFRNQEGYISRLIKRTAAYWSFNQVSTFLTRVRDVTAEFELQRVSLGAIIQDQQRANQLFAEIKSFALTSPLKILDLTKYTKQVAAYGFETEKLFDTTKMLADISVGLGVDMSRLTLFLGQVYATGYLRASEVRQATEAGIPLVEKLSQKLSEANGRLVSAAEVMDLISKRAISFELVEEVFKDMTSAGGMFFEMQEKQGNTLFGMWAKLGDAASVMYDQIGNTKVVNEGMKAAIEALTEFMRNWKSSVAQMGVVAGALGLRKLATVIKGWQSTIVSERLAANARLTAAQNAYNASLAAEAAAIKANTDVTNHNANAKAAQATATRISAKASLEAAFAESRAAAATTLWSKAWNKLKAAFMGNWVTLLLTALAALVTHFLMAEDAAARLKNTLADIGAESERETAEAVGKFKILADRAVEAADGSKAQRDALEELKNTYGNIIPYEYLTLENLRKMKGEYGELTTMIEEYNAKLKLTNSQNAIEEEYAPKEKERRTKLRKKLTEDGFELDTGKDVFVQEIKFNPVTTQKFFNELNEISKTVTDKSEAIRQAVQAIWSDLGIEDEYFEDVVNAMINFDRHELEGQGTMMDYAEALIEKNRLLQQEQDNYDKAAESLNKYTAIVDNLKKSIEDRGKESFSDDESYANYLENEKQKIQDVYGAIVEVMNNENAEVITAYNGLIAQLNNGTITYTNLLEQLLNLPLSAKGHSAVSQIQQIYAQLAPTDETVIVARNKFASLANSMEVSMFAVQRSQMKQGESLKDHRKTIVSEIDTINDKILELMYRKTQLAAQGYSTKGVEDELANQQKLLGFYNAYLATLPKFEKETNKSRGTKSDNRLQNLQEIERTLTSINKKYEELAKTEGNTAALEYVRKNYDSTLKYINKLGEQFNLNFAMPTDFKDLQSYRKAIQGVIEQLKMKGYEKAAIELELKIAEGNQAQLQKEIQAKLKALADRISRTKTAKEFYEKILSQTGDKQLALNLTTSIYGENGQDLKGQVVNQIRTALDDTKVELPSGIIDVENNINYKELRKFAEKAKETKAIGENVANELIKIADNGEKELNRIAQEGAKLLLKYDEIAQQRVNIEQEASNQIKTLRKAEALYLASNASEAEKVAYSKRTNKAVAGVEADRDLKLLKLQDEYLRFFSAIHSLTNKEAEALRTKVREALFKAFQSGAISADELKRELKAVDEQFQKLIDDSGFAMDYLKGGFDGLFQRLRDTADEVQSVAAEISKMESPDQISEGQKSFIDKILGKFGDKTTGSNFADLFSKTNGNLKEMGGLLGKVSGKMGGMAQGAAKALAIVDMIIKAVDSTIRGIAQIRDQLNEMRSDDNQLGGGFWDAFEYLENFNKYAASGWEKLKSGDVIGAVADTVSSIISIFGTAQAQKVRKANKEIKRQQELLDQLEYSYGRLEKAADKAFGADFVANQKQQQKILLAQQQAYMKQYEAEMSKGKKADKEKAQEFLDKARDVGDQIADMQGKIAERMLGTDLTSAARDFANAWLEAYKEFGNTADAMSEKFHEMIQNMIVESLLAKVMERALKPAFDMIDNMNEEDFYSESFWKKVMATAEQGAKDADHGAGVVMKWIEKMGYDMREMGSEYSGIAKEVSSASSEEINQLSAFVNTALYYVSPIPTISENVSLIRQLMERGTTSTLPDTTAAGWTDWQQQAMDNYNAIARNTADTVVECRRAAVACEAATEKLNRIIVVKGGKFAVNTTYI